MNPLGRKCDLRANVLGLHLIKSTYYLPMLLIRKIELIEHLSIKRYTLEKMQPLQHNWAFPILSRFSQKWWKHHIQQLLHSHWIVVFFFFLLPPFLVKTIFFREDYSFLFIHSFECVWYKEKLNFQRNK